MNTESQGQDSNQPKDRLDTETGKLISLNQSPAAPAKAVKQEEPLKMWFGDALDALIGGTKFIRRLSWPEGECVFFGTAFMRLQDGKESPFECLLHRRPDDSPRPWAMGRADLEGANDWIVVSEGLSADQ